MVTRGLVQEVAGTLWGCSIVEAEGELTDLCDVILPTARQPLVEVLDRRDHGQVVVFGVDSILSEGVQIRQQDPGFRGRRYPSMGGQDPLRQGGAGAGQREEKDRRRSGAHARRPIAAGTQTTTRGPPRSRALPAGGPRSPW